MFLRNLLLVCTFVTCSFEVEAGGMGKTENIVEIEGIAWNGVYHDMYDINFDALLPNYSGTVWANGQTMLRGKIGDFGYLISCTPRKIKVQKSIQAFIELVQHDNPGHEVKAAESPDNVVYALDLIPSDPSSMATYRFFLTKNGNIIQFCTTDDDVERQETFFTSLNLK